MSTPPPQYEPAPPVSPDPVTTSPPAALPVWRPLENRLLAVKIVFGLITGIWLLAVLSGVFELALVNRVLGDENVPAGELNASDNRQMLLGWVQWAAWAGGATVFIMWLYRAYQNVDAVAPGQRRFGHGWAIGSWFVPILNLWRPKKIVNDVWRAGELSREPSVLLVLWWLLWIANGFISNAARRVYNTADTPEEWRTGIIRYLVADGVGAVAAFLAIFVAVTLTRNLNRRASHVADAARFREANNEAPIAAPSVATITPSETPTGR